MLSTSADHLLFKLYWLLKFKLIIKINVKKTWIWPFHFVPLVCTALSLGTRKGNKQVLMSHYIQCLVQYLTLKVIQVIRTKSISTDCCDVLFQCLEQFFKIKIRTNSINSRNFSQSFFSFCAKMFFLGKMLKMDGESQWNKQWNISELCLQTTHLCVKCHPVQAGLKKQKKITYESRTNVTLGLWCQWPFIFGNLTFPWGFFLFLPSLTHILAAFHEWKWALWWVPKGGITQLIFLQCFLSCYPKNNRAKTQKP